LRVAFAGGGTGGHIVPGIHLVERIKVGVETDADAASPPELGDLLWFTSGRAVEDRVLEDFDPPCPWERCVLDLEPMGGGAPSRVRLALGLPGAIRAARRALREHETRVLLGLGGFTALPAALAARSLGLPVGLLEINATRGKATRALSPLVQRVFHAWPSTLPARGADSCHRQISAPVSPAVTALGVDGGDRAAACGALGFDPDRPLLVVLGGSQGAGSLNRFIRDHEAALTGAGIQVLHQCGPGRQAELPASGVDLQVVEYVQPVSRALEAATLVLCRGGASTLAEVAAARQPAVVIPYPHHADRHQELNARHLGAGVRIVADSALDSDLATELVGLCGPDGAESLLKMSSALAEAAPGDAALEVLLELECLTQTGAR
jgi:UDP-N-acetylglucosamine:LPS N-acetylglucosamine transferase